MGQHSHGVTNSAYARKYKEIVAEYNREKIKLGESRLNGMRSCGGCTGTETAQTPSIGISNSFNLVEAAGVELFHTLLFLQPADSKKENMYSKFYFFGVIVRVSDTEKSYQLAEIHSFD